MDLSDLAFGGGGLDRSAHLRPRAEELWANGTARVLPLWRGRPLFTAERATGRALDLVFTTSDHPLVADNAPRTLYLGQHDDRPLFAVDISGWTPPFESADGGPGFAGEPVPVAANGLPPDAHFADLRAALHGLDPWESEVAATARGLFEWHRSHRYCANCGQPSTIAQAGWRRDCPACGRQHFPRTDPVVIMLVTHGNSVLLGRSPGWPEGMYSLLAGFMEPGETIEAATRREVWEETGISCGPVEMLASQPWPFPASLMIGTRTEATSTEIAIDPVEIEHALWVTREDLAQAFAGTHPVIRKPRRGAIAQVLLKNWLAGTLPIPQDRR
ncbi:NAD(+) diphosphatase [uncultured Maritimibacter sp.]|jgi:NAD+ diphosphatase|uniref:NAD(+) diphosphatase n=1 Tax=uncultured Maritimibacter sp. TaxID=991866 RepID=UPI000A978A9E|nr:NAD(+) diphosphatase [uncultured Maritimibacter sp.]